MYAIYKNGNKNSIVDGYLGGFANLFSTSQPPLPFRAGPSHAVIDLETMKVLSITAGIRTPNDIQKAIRACNSIK